MESLFLEKRIELLFFGYVREFQRDTPWFDVPQSLVLEVITFYERYSFEWDASRKGAGIVLSNGNKSACFNGSRWKTVLSKNLMRADQVSSVHWEVTLKQLPESNIVLMLGFVAEWGRNTVNLESYLGQTADHALYIPGGNSQFKIHPKLAHDHMFESKWNTTMCNVGDRIELRFDFDTKRCRLRYNSELVGLLTDKLPDGLYPALAFYKFVPLAVETTKWTVNRK